MEARVRRPNQPGRQVIVGEKTGDGGRHIGGGGDWEWTLRAMRDGPGLYIDTSGSVVDEGMIEKAADLVGVEHLLFACDMTMCGGVGKILAADITEQQREMIFSGNMRELLGGRV